MFEPRHFCRMKIDPILLKVISSDFGSHDPANSVYVLHYTPTASNLRGTKTEISLQNHKGIFLFC